MDAKGQRDTRVLMIASRDELASMSAREAFERTSEALVGMMVTVQDFIDQNAGRLGPDQLERFRGHHDGLEHAATMIGATLEHGFEQ